MFIYESKQYNSLSNDDNSIIDRKLQIYIISYEFISLKYEIEGITLNNLDTKIQVKKGIKWPN